MKICIVGGGGSVAVATRIITEKRSDAVIEVFTKREVAGYRPCELTYVLGRQIQNFETIVNFDADAMKKKNIRYHFKTSVTEINRDEHYIVSDDGKFEYDKLILATGASPILPKISGIDGKGIYVLGTDIAYGQELEKVILEKKSALILGAGAIGLEMAEVMADRGYDQVMVVDMADRPLFRSLDGKMANMVTERLEAKGITFSFLNGVEKIQDQGDKKLITLKDRQVTADLVLVSAGFRPNNELGLASGLEIGQSGGIKVNKQMLTSDEDIYAIGDVSEGYDILSGHAVLSMKADNAVRTAKVAALHLCGNLEVDFPGSTGGFIIYLNETFVGGVGYTEETAVKLMGSNVKAVWHEAMTLPKYLGGKPIKIKLIYDQKSRLLLGAQMLSKANFVTELDRLSLAISEKITVDRLAVTEIVYTPASGWPYGPVSQALDKCT